MEFIVSLACKTGCISLMVTFGSLFPNAYGMDCLYASFIGAYFFVPAILFYFHKSSEESPLENSPLYILGFYLVLGFGFIGQLIGIFPFWGILKVVLFPLLWVEKFLDGVKS